MIATVVIGVKLAGASRTSAQPMDGASHRTKGPMHETTLVQVWAVDVPPASRRDRCVIADWSDQCANLIRKVKLSTVPLFGRLLGLVGDSGRARQESGTRLGPPVAEYASDQLPTTRPATQSDVWASS